MANAALQMEKFKTVDKLLPPRGPNVYNAGIKDADKGIIRYASPSNTNPNLIIVDPISDDDGNYIMPGYYSLVLSYDRQNLILSQRNGIVAIIPVFKIEEDRKQEETPPPMDNKSLKKYNKEQKKKEKEKKKLFKDGKITSEPEVYNSASIEYDPDGYYLIKYEKGKIRAWGAIKQ